jgi:hypothetical protein
MTRRFVLTVLGTAGAAAAGSALLVSPAAARAPLAVQGTVSGSYTAVTTNPDTGHRYKVTASGHTSLGATTATGHVQGPGNVASGRCTARLTLTTSKGKLVVAARGTDQVKSFASCQSGFAFTWKTVKATGSYTGKSPSGDGTLTLVKSSNSSESPPPAYVTFDPES